MKYDFYVHTYKDDPTKILDQIKKFHPNSIAVVIPDEGQLKNKSVRWITRWFDVARSHGSELIVKVDPDSSMLKGFDNTFPDADFFGKVIRYKNYGEEEKTCIHGGTGQFLTRKFVDLIYDQITDEIFFKKEFMYRGGFISVDKILAYLAKQNEVPLVEYDSGIIHKFNVASV